MSSTKKRASRKLPGFVAGRIAQKLRTRRQILTAASTLVAAGKSPSVAEAADAASVSRRTAYRYFPTRAKLLTEAALEGLRVPMEAALGNAPAAGRHAQDVEARVAALIEQMQSMAVRNESLLRTMIHQTVLGSAPAITPRRGTRRIDWIESAVKPLRNRLGEKAHARLVSGLALCGGIEALLVLRDIRGLSVAAAIEVSRWAAQALLEQTLRDLETRDQALKAKPSSRLAKKH